MSKLFVKNRYGVIPVEILNNEKLSMRAKGLWAYMQAKPDNWAFSIERIAKQTLEGREAIQTAIKELESQGYLIRMAVKDENGRWNGYDYELYDKPLTAEPMAEIPLSVKPSSISNIDSSKKDNSKIDIDIAESSSAEVIPDLLKDKQKHIQIIGLWARAKQVQFTSKEHQRTFIKRNLRAAKELAPYPSEKIIETMAHLIKQNDFKPTLESVGKFIDEPDLNRFNKNKIVII